MVLEKEYEALAVLLHGVKHAKLNIWKSDKLNNGLSSIQTQSFSIYQNVPNTKVDFFLLNCIVKTVNNFTFAV